MKNQFANRVRTGSLSLLAATLSLSCFAFVLGMPWQDLGVWPEQELTASGVYAVSAITAALMGLLAALRDRKALGALTSAPILVLAVLSLWTLALAPYSSAPWTSVYGTLQHDVGGLWHLDAAILAAGSAVVLASKWRPFLLGALAVSGLAVAAIATAPWAFGIPRQFLFPEWAGLATGAVALAIAVRARKLASWQVAVAAAVFVSGIAASGNRAVLVAAVAAAALALAFRLPVVGNVLRRRAPRAAVAMVMPVAGLVAMWAAGPAIEAYRLSSPTPVVESVASGLPQDRLNLMDGTLGTLWSRSYMIRIIVKDLEERPSTLLHGNGWGSFNEVYERHAREVPGRMFPAAVASASRTYWDSHTKADFHSHNMAAEALNAGGIPGLLLWLAFLGTLAASSRSGLIVSAALAVASTFWFPLTHMTEALAAMVASGLALGRSSSRTRAWMSALAPLPAAAALSALAMAGFLSLSLARLETGERRFEGVAVDRNPETCAAITARFLPEREATLYLYRVLVNKVMASPDRYRTLFNQATNYALLSCSLRSHSLLATDIRSLAESLAGRAKMAAIGPGALGLVSDDLIAWGKDLDLMLAAAPERTDFIPPYILSLRSRNNPRLVAETERYAARLQSDDPVRHFLLSIAAEAKGDVSGSKEFMRRALSLGYANLQPTDKALVDSVRAE